MSDPAKRPPVYAIFTHLTMSHHMHGYWRHPKGRGQLDFYKLEPWIQLAKTAEAAGTDALFLADTLGTYSTYKGGWEITAEIGMQFPGHDPAVMLSALARETEHLGLAITSSVLQDHPFSFARKMSTLDHVTDGRIGWNIVTSYLRNSARNYGLPNTLPHQERYAWAEEYVDAVYKLWEQSWEDDAIVADPVTGRYLDSTKIHKVNHVGARYRIEGPHLVLPSPQRTPFLFQAGASADGRGFSARHAEGIFLPSMTPEQVRTDISDIRARMVALGRNPDTDARFFVLIAPIFGSTEAEARRAEQELDDNLNLEGVMAHISEGMGVDLSQIDPNAPIGDFHTEYAQSTIGALISAEPDKTATFGDLVRRRVRKSRIVGTPEQIADRIQSLVDAGAGGFNIQPVTIFGWFEEFADHVVPTLRRRGLWQSEYRPGTLREKILPHQQAHLPDYHPARQLRDTPRVPDLPAR